MIIRDLIILFLFIGCTLQHTHSIRSIASAPELPTNCAAIVSQFANIPQNKQETLTNELLNFSSKVKEINDNYNSLRSDEQELFGYTILINKFKVEDDQFDEVLLALDYNGPLTQNQMMKFSDLKKKVELLTSKYNELSKFRENFIQEQQKYSSEILSSKWSNHGDKHKKAKSFSEAKKLSESEAQYLPEIDNQIIEKFVIQNYDKGYILDRGNKGIWIYMHIDSQVGFNNGISTNWIRVEVQSSTYHGHPADPARVRHAVGDTAFEFLERNSQSTLD
jgi:hypothetical protein